MVAPTVGRFRRVVRRQTWNPYRLRTARVSCSENETSEIPGMVALGVMPLPTSALETQLTSPSEPTPQVGFRLGTRGETGRRLRNEAAGFRSQRQYIEREFHLLSRAAVGVAGSPPYVFPSEPIAQL
jgi:hypothetical protein